MWTYETFTRNSISQIKIALSFMRTIKRGNIHSKIINIDNNNLELKKLEHYQYSTIFNLKIWPEDRLIQALNSNNLNK